MTPSHAEELVYVTMEDGLLLEGVAMKPVCASPGHIPALSSHESGIPACR
jgi:hypothetical protein